MTNRCDSLEKIPGKHCGFELKWRDKKKQTRTGRKRMEGRRKERKKNNLESGR
jgi:hypothetical protein